jgi:transposase-like protein
MSTVEVALVQETEVADKATRRTFTAEYKRRIVKEADACKASGEIGSLLRREGLYSSQLANWRDARERGDLAPGAVAKKRVRAPGEGRSSQGTPPRQQQPGRRRRAAKWLQKQSGRPAPGHGPQKQKPRITCDDPGFASCARRGNRTPMAVNR